MPSSAEDLESTGVVSRELFWYYSSGYSADCRTGDRTRESDSRGSTLVRDSREWLDGSHANLVHPTDLGCVLSIAGFVYISLGTEGLREHLVSSH